MRIIPRETIENGVRIGTSGLRRNHKGITGLVIKDHILRNSQIVTSAANQNNTNHHR